MLFILLLKFSYYYLLLLLICRNLFYEFRKNHVKICLFFLKRLLILILDRVRQDRIVDDYYPCTINNNCDLKHAYNLLKLYIYLYNTKIRNKISLYERIGLNLRVILENTIKKFWINFEVEAIHFCLKKNRIIK